MNEVTSVESVAGAPGIPRTRAGALCLTRRHNHPALLGALRASLEQGVLQARFMERYVGAMARRGVLLRRDVNFISAAHSEAQVDSTVRASDEALRQLEAAS